MSTGKHVPPVLGPAGFAEAWETGRVPWIEKSAICSQAVSSISKHKTLHPLQQHNKRNAYTTYIPSFRNHLVPDNEQIGIASSKSLVLRPFLPRPEAYVEMDGRLLSLDQWMDPEFGWVT